MMYNRDDDTLRCRPRKNECVTLLLNKQRRERQKVA